jgi:hypothetical protein
MLVAYLGKAIEPRRYGRENRPGGGTGVTVSEPDEAATEVFDAEVRSAVRYEMGLACKALAALAIVAVVILLRLLFLG